MRKYAKIIASTTLLASGSYAFGFHLSTDPNSGLAFLAGAGGGVTSSSTYYNEYYTNGSSLLPPPIQRFGLTSVNFGSGNNGNMDLSAGLRYYFHRWFVGAIADYNPIKNNYFSYSKSYPDSLSGSFNTSTDQLNSNWFIDYGLQAGFEIYKNVRFFVSALGADNNMNYGDSAITTNQLTTTDATLNFQGYGFGVGFEYQLTHNLFVSGGYRYISYDSESVVIGNRFNASGPLVRNTSATIEPTDNMVDMSLVAEF